MVKALLAAGASVEAKDDRGPGPQRPYQCDRTDIVGRWCNRQHVKEMRHDIEVVVPFTTSSFEESLMDFR